MKWQFASSGLEWAFLSSEKSAPFVGFEPCFLRTDEVTIGTNGSVFIPTSLMEDGFSGGDYFSQEGFQNS